MWRAPLRRLFLRSITPSPSPSPSITLSTTLPSLQQPHHISPPSNPFIPTQRPLSSSSSSSKPPTTSFGNKNKHITGTDRVSKAISLQLLQDPTTEPLTLSQRLDLHFSHIQPTPQLLLQVLNQSPDAGRTVLDFHQWVSTRPGFKHTDETFSYLIDYFGRRKDFKVIHQVLIDGRGVTGVKTLGKTVDRLVKAGRDAQTVGFFERMEKHYGFVRDLDSLKLVVAALCDNGFASHAEKLVKSLANEFFPDEVICDLLIRGWCVDGKLDEAKRLAGEMNRGGFDLGVVAYNAILDCVCKLCRKKDPFQLKPEAEKILIEMEYAGIPHSTETFNVLNSNLCKLRMTEEAVKLFERMGEWGCSPDSTSYLLLIKSLYQAARVGEGDEMIDQMKSAGFGQALDKKAYYGFLKVLCGIERIDHAMSVFIKMKSDGCEPGIKTFDLLMGKLCAHSRVEKSNALFKEAKRRGLPVIPKVYKLDPRFAKKPKAKKPVKPKMETFPEKMARKRKTLRKIRLSFVKKPKKMMRRAF